MKELWFAFYEGFPCLLIENKWFAQLFIKKNFFFHKSEILLYFMIMGQWTHGIICERFLVLDSSEPSNDTTGKVLKPCIHVHIFILQADPITLLLDLFNQPDVKVKQNKIYLSEIFSILII